MYGLYVKRKKIIQYLFLVVLVMIVASVSFSLSDANEIIVRFVTILLLLWCIKMGLDEPVKLNPYLLFSLTPISLLLYTEKVSYYYLNHLQLRTWWIAIMNFFVFLSFLYLTNKKKKKKKMNSTLEMLNNNNLVFHSLLFLSVGIFLRVYRMVFHKLFFLNSVLIYFNYLALCAALKSKKKWLISVVVAFFLIGYLSGFNKTMFISLGMTVFVALEKYYIKTKRQKAIVYGLALVFMVLMISVGFPLKDYMTDGGTLWGYFSGIEITSSFAGYGNRIEMGRLNAFRIPYMYLVSAWNNLQYVMETQQNHTYGLWMFKPLIGYFQMDGLFSDSYVLEPYSSFNTFTYITVLYKDFGFYGSIIGSAFLGWFVMWVYRLYLNSDSPLWVGSYAMTACATFEMFFSNHFFGLSYPFSIIIISYIYCVLLKYGKNSRLWRNKNGKMAN